MTQSPRPLCRRPTLAIENPCAVGGCVRPIAPGFSRCAVHLEIARKYRAARRVVWEANAAARETETKVCRKCQEPRPLSDYYLNRAAKDGLQSYCKDCFRGVDVPVRPMPPAEPGKRRRMCDLCCGLSHARAPGGCPRCLEPFAEEDLTECFAEIRAARRWDRAV